MLPTTIDGQRPALQVGSRAFLVSASVPAEEIASTPRWVPSPEAARQRRPHRPEPHDLRLGEVGGAPFYIDADQYERWGEPRFLIDVAPGGAEGFSLEGLLDMHFISRAP